MKLNRRTLLQSAAAVAGYGFVGGLRADEANSYALEIKPGLAELLEENGPKTAIWGYDGIVPGPVIKGKKGQRLKVAVTNRLQQSTSVHWHGIRIDNAMDGVAGLTQAAIEPGETFVYDFVTPDAGTFWYHSHQRSWEQQARGLYGPLIIEEDMPAGVHRDLTIVADDWRLENGGAIHETSLGDIRDKAHAGRLGNVLTLNGKPYERLGVFTGERVRLRLINSANSRVMSFKLGGVAPWLVALDGQPIEAIEVVEAAVRLTPAQRADLVFDVNAPAGSELAISEVSGDEPLVAGYLEVSEPEVVGRPVWEGVPKLPANNVPRVKADGARLVKLEMTGGAMQPLRSAIFKGKEVDGRTLALEHGQAWALNGIAGTTAEPLFVAARNEHIIIRMRNDTRWPHAMHLHGFHFVELSRKPLPQPDFSLASGEVSAAAPLRDTVFMDAGEEVEIGFVADNPGHWLLHCHMTEHMAGGMVTWFEVKP